jgi:Glycosyltransferase family 10 (fucosyltransferase).
MEGKFKINILTPHEKKVFIHQLPENGVEEFEFFEDGDFSQIYDLIVVYEGVKDKVTLKCSAENILFISGEPPLSRVYTKGFVDQFSYIISSHAKLKHPRNIQSQQCLPWHFGFDFQAWEYKYTHQDLLNIERPLKTKKMSIIVSNKTMMPGHSKRVRFVNALKERFGDNIDFFGKGINPVRDKADAILPYYMTICIENSAIENYWTEKIADAYLGYSLPIYYGCTNIKTYFPEESVFDIDINCVEEALDKIGYLLDNCENIYLEALPNITESRRLLLSNYNIFPVLAEFVRNNKIQLNSVDNEVTLTPNHYFNDYKIEMILLKMKRFLNKWIM